MRVLAIDIGSSSVKAGLWTGRGFGRRARVGYRTVFDGVKVEAPVNRIIQAMRQAVGEVAEGRGRIDAIGFCTFSSGVVVTDAGEGGGKIRAGAITHQDRRSVLEARGLCDLLGEKWLLAHTGNLPYPGGIGSSTLAWLGKHERAVFRGDYRVGQLSTVIGALLTGEWVIDPSQAVFLGLWDFGGKRWSEEVCAAVGVKAGSLPRVVWADEWLGGLSAAGGRLLGVKAGTPVVGGFVDSSAGVIQTPMRAGQLAHSAGSTDVLAMCLDKAAPAAGVLSRPVGTGARFPERWLAVRTIAAAGSAIEWVRRSFFCEQSARGWARMLDRRHAWVMEEVRRFSRAARSPALGVGAGKFRRQAEAGAPSCAGVGCIATFAGDRMAIEQVGGACFSGVTLATTREELLDSVLLALARESGESYRRLAEIHAPSKMVYTMGGAGQLGQTLHRAWAGRHEFAALKGDTLHGLVKLAEGAGG